MKTQRTYKWYLIVSLIYSSITVLYGLILIIFKIPTVAQVISGALMSPLIFGIFILNTVMFTVFVIGKSSKIMLVLSGMYIFDFLFSMLVGVITFSILGDAAGQNAVIHMLGMIFPILTLMLSIKLIRHS